MSCRGEVYSIKHLFNYKILVCYGVTHSTTQHTTQQKESYGLQSNLYRQNVYIHSFQELIVLMWSYQT